MPGIRLPLISTFFFLIKVSPHLPVSHVEVKNSKNRDLPDTHDAVSFIEEEQTDM